MDMEAPSDGLQTTAVVSLDIPESGLFADSGLKMIRVFTVRLNVERPHTNTLIE